MASAQVKTDRRLSKLAESYNGCSSNFSERKSSVEKSVEWGTERPSYLTTADIPAQVLSRFHTFVNITPTCWLWTASVDQDGYGQLARPHRSPIKAHRLAWVMAHGPIASSQHVLHRCDTPRCINPLHLFLGNQDANMKDAAVKGRLHTERPHKQTIPQDVVNAIRDAPAERGIGARLSRQFFVSQSFVSFVRRGLRRQHSLLGNGA